MNFDGYIALIGLGAIGAPLAKHLYSKYGNRFILLSDSEIAKRLKKQTIYINGEVFNPKIVTPDDTLDAPVDVIFVCVKNYSIKSAVDSIKPFVNGNTVILPLQNGVFSYSYFRNEFKDNVILEGFAQGPNTRIFENNYVYQNSGEYFIGKHNEDFKAYAEYVYSILKNADIPCKTDDDIRHLIWRKMMLNVAGNALTALTGLDYSMFKRCPEAQSLCNLIMREYAEIANAEGVSITDEDIEYVISYYTNYKNSKHTSMLEDVINNRQTENEYIAGYIKKLAEKHGINTPYINSLYSLMKIKEDVYLGKLN